jgi:phthiocerol/phenolphthiocerol synthesis type-I polyketide synthase C
VRASAADIEGWLLEHLQARLGPGAETVDSHMPFSYYGLTSIDAVVLAGELQDWLGSPVSPTLTWEYPTVSAVARYLADEPVAVPAAAVDFKALLAELDAPPDLRAT